MGFLAAGSTLAWEDMQEVKEYIREHGIAQFLSVYTALQDRRTDSTMFGDEVEWVSSHMALRPLSSTGAAGRSLS